jgi:broad specificity phosphatase PhoE
VLTLGAPPSAGLCCYTRAVFDSSIRITLVRHGESVANRSQRWQGHGNSELSELGRAQARALATRLAGRRFDRVVVSDLERAQATARALELPFDSDPMLREFDIGAWEGLTREQVVAQFGEQLARLDAGEDVAIGGGESYVSFCARVDDSLGRLRATLTPGQHALVVCHGGVIGALVAGALGLRGARSLPIGRVLNTAVSELSYDAAGHATLHVFNDSLHLAELSLFPHPTEMNHALALICEGSPHPSFGLFDAHYDFERRLDELLAGAADGTASFAEVIAGVQARHPERRVAMSASASRIHGWAGETVWNQLVPAGALSVPRSGALCHVTGRDGHLALVDYGILV